MRRGIISNLLVRLMFVLAGFAMICFGIYIGCFESKGFEKTTAVIVDVVEEIDYSSEDSNAKTYTATVTYTVDGKEYTQQLDYWKAGYKVGKEIEIKYNPADPTVIHGATADFVVYLIVAGTALALVGAYLLVFRRR